MLYVVFVALFNVHISHLNLEFETSKWFPFCFCCVKKVTAEIRNETQNYRVVASRHSCTVVP